MSGRRPGPIGIVADDLTGAAELAGIAHDRGLTVELVRGVPGASNADVILLDTDTRSMTGEQARQRTEAGTVALRAIGCGLLFKKVDSLLRGNVAAEIAGMLAAAHYRRCLLVPANWQAGRTIVEGRLAIDGRRLEDTWAASDPEYPRTTSLVRELLHGPNGGDARANIVVPDVSHQAAAEAALNTIDQDTLPAGGAEFFALWLDRQKPPGPAAIGPTPLLGRRLLVVGSRAGWLAWRAVADAERSDVATDQTYDCVSAIMPESCLAPESLAEDSAADWGRDVARSLSDLPDRLHVMAIGRDQPVTTLRPRELVERLAAAAAIPAGDLTAADAVLIEGGGTSAALLDRLRRNRFAIGGRWAPGVVELRSLSPQPGPRFVVKVGSYRWPESLLDRLAASRQPPPGTAAHVRNSHGGSR